MPRRPEQPARCTQKISAKTAYSRAASKKLSETRARLAGVNARLKSAIATGRIDPNLQLEQAQRAVDLNLAAAAKQIARVRKAGADDWESLTDEVDSAWEDLSQSIKKLVARFSDLSR